MIIDGKIVFKIVNAVVAGIVLFYVISRNQYSDQNCYLYGYTNGTVQDKTLYSILPIDCQNMKNSNITLYNFLNTVYGVCSTDFSYHYTNDIYTDLVYFFSFGLLIFAEIAYKYVDQEKTLSNITEEYKYSLSNTFPKIKALRMFLLVKMLSKTSKHNIKYSFSVILNLVYYFKFLKGEIVSKDEKDEKSRELYEEHKTTFTDHEKMLPRDSNIKMPEHVEIVDFFTEILPKVYRRFSRIVFILYLLSIFVLTIVLWVHRNYITTWFSTDVCSIPRFARSSVTAFSVIMVVLDFLIFLSFI